MDKVIGSKKRNQIQKSKQLYIYKEKTSKGVAQCSQSWWYTPIVSSHRRLRWEDHEFRDNLGCIVSSKPSWDNFLRSCFKTNKWKTKPKQKRFTNCNGKVGIILLQL